MKLQGWLVIRKLQILLFSEVDDNVSHHTSFSTNDSRFEVREVGGVLKLVAVSGAQFDYETETSISVEITQTDGAKRVFKLYG